MTTTLEAIGPTAYRGGAGTPLLLLHGLFMTWRAWQPVLEGLEQHHDVFAPTLLGHRGATAYPPDRVGIDPLADAIEASLDRIGWDRVHVVGNSLGGWLALELARRGRARTVTAFSPAGSWAGSGSYAALRAKLRLVSALARRGLLDRPAVRGTVLRGMVANPARMSDASARAVSAEARDCTALPPLEDWFRRNGPLTPFDLRGVPVRIAWPDRDRTIPWRYHGTSFRGLVPDAEFVRLRGVGHVPMTDDPGLVIRTILDVTRR